MLRNHLNKSKILSLNVVGDGATITSTPFVNILTVSPNNLFELLEIVDNTD
jgi:hypothetical protein